MYNYLFMIDIVSLIFLYTHDINRHLTYVDARIYQHIEKSMAPSTYVCIKAQLIEHTVRMKLKSKF